MNEFYRNIAERLSTDFASAMLLTYILYIYIYRERERERERERSFRTFRTLPVKAGRIVQQDCLHNNYFADIKRNSSVRGKKGPMISMTTVEPL